MLLTQAFHAQSENQGIRIPCILMCTSGLGDLATYPWLVLVLLYSIRALQADHAVCRSSSWTWLWVACVMAGSMLLHRMNKVCTCQCTNTNDDEQKTSPAQFMSMYAILGLSLGLSTNFHFLEGCAAGSQAHHALYVFMWGWYAHCIWIAVMGVVSMGLALCYSRREDVGYSGV